MKILFVLEHYHPFIGGAEVLFKHLCEGLVQKGHEVTVITSRLAQTVELETINGVKILRIKTPLKASRYWFTLLAIPAAIRLAKDADIIHTTTYNGAFPAWLASRLRGKKCIITVLEIIGPHWSELQGMSRLMAWLHRTLEGLIISLPFDLYIAISRYTSDCLKSYVKNDRKVQVIYPGVDNDLFDPRKAKGSTIRDMLGIKDSFVYMYYGRPGISKGVEYLVAALPRVFREVPKSRFLIILTKEPADGCKKITEMINRLNMGERIILLEPVPRGELPDYIASADCTVVPSLSEGFGFSAAEACAMEKPVVASNIASLPEVVSGNYILVDPGNSDALARAMIDVYKGNMKHTEKKTFMWSTCIDNYDTMYARLGPGKQGDQR